MFQFIELLRTQNTFTLKR